MSSDAFAMLVMTGFAATHLAPFAAPFFYWRAEKETRALWQAKPLPARVLESAAYRSGGEVVTGHYERAPTSVRVAAASSIVFGSMFVPGLAWGLVGLVMMGAGLLSIPGLVVAACLWSSAHKLLRGDQEGAIASARAATGAFYFNVLLVLGAVLVALLAESQDVLPMAAFVGGYALLSIGQALLVAKAARTVGALHGDVVEGVVEDQLPFMLRRLIEARRAKREALSPSSAV
jgi:hypothetical protein